MLPRTLFSICVIDIFWNYQKKERRRRNIWLQEVLANEVNDYMKAWYD
jgi:hypothetical protein